MFFWIFIIYTGCSVVLSGTLRNKILFIVTCRVSKVMFRRYFSRIWSSALEISTYRATFRCITKVIDALFFLELLHIMFPRAVAAGDGSWRVQGAVKCADLARLLWTFRWTTTACRLRAKKAIVPVWNTKKKKKPLKSGATVKDCLTALASGISGNHQTVVCSAPIRFMYFLSSTGPLWKKKERERGEAGYGGGETWERKKSEWK